MCAVDMATQFYTVEQVAGMFGVHKNTVLNWIRTRELIAIQFGRGYRIAQADLDDFIRRKRTDRGKDG